MTRFILSNKRPLINDVLVPYTMLKYRPMVEMSVIPADTYYTIVIVDISEIPYLQMLKVNAPHEKKYCQPYERIFKNHVFLMAVYRQRDFVSGPCQPERRNFDLESYADSHGLELVAQVKFKVVGGYDNPGSMGHSYARGGYDYDRDTYFKEDNQPSEHQGRYCRCVAHVKAKNSPECNMTHDYGHGKCYNPYAVCSKTVGRDEKECGKYYDLSRMPRPEVQAIMETEAGSRQQQPAELFH